MDKKLWSGRFSESLEKDVEEFTQSVSFDKELAIYDIYQDFAHIEALLKANLLSKESYDNIKNALYKALEKIKDGSFEWKKELEDVHMNIESFISSLSKDGKLIHTGRSRNDQVITDLKLYIKDKLLELYISLKNLRRALTKKAKESIDIIIPSYTHLQRAMLIRASHFFLSYREMFLRDSQRLLDCYQKTDILPLGSAAVAGSDFDIDRFLEASILGFNKVSRNSIDAVSDRDFLIELLSLLSTIMMHLSRLSEDLIIYNSEEFSFIELPDKICTGSSIMPQKKNPDVLELIRGKTARVYGSLVSILTLTKALPTAYNRDLQEDKEPTFDAIKTTISSVNLMAKTIEYLSFKEENIKLNPFIFATELANYLAKKGVPFREAHEIVGSLVKLSKEKNIPFDKIHISTLKEFSDKFEEDVYKIFEPSFAPDSKKTYGSTAKKEILKQLQNALLEDF